MKGILIFWALAFCGAMVFFSLPDKPQEVREYSLADEACPTHQSEDMELHNLMAHGMWQHGPTDPKDCTHFCSPSGDVRDAPEGVEQIKCPGNGSENSCTKQGSQCGSDNRPGCSTNCKSSCCGCCSI